MTSAYEVARGDGAVYVRVHGLANMKNAPVLDEFLRTELAGKQQTVCVELSDCSGMDSTFMGLLVGFHLRLAEQDGQLVVVNPTAGNRRLLDMLGVSEVLPVVTGQEPPSATFVTLATSGPHGPLHRAEMMREAHSNLVSLSEANRAKFSPFLLALEADLERLRSQTRSDLPE